MGIFKKLVLYLIDMGKEVNLYLCPLLASLWYRIENDGGLNEYYILYKIEIFVNEIARKYSLRIKNYYNPYNLNIKEKNFYNTHYLQYEQLNKFLNFTLNSDNKKGKQYNLHI